MFQKLKSKLQKLLEHPNYTCVCCGREIFDGSYFCPSCLKILPFNHNDCCQICGREVENAVEVCQECTQDRPLYTMAKSSFVYREEIVQLLYRFKNGDRFLADAFVAFADYFLASTIFAVDYLVYVPMFIEDEKRRGYNQAKVLAEAIAKRYALPIVEDKLLKIKKTPAQKSLKKAGRIQNLKDCFVVTDKNFFQGKKVLLIDDILTTGATSDILAKLLKENGCSQIYLYTIASVPLQKEYIKIEK